MATITCFFMVTTGSSCKDEFQPLGLPLNFSLPGCFSAADRLLLRSNRNISWII